MSDIDISIAGNSQQAEKAYDRLQKENDKLAKKLEQLQAKSAKATNTTAGGFEKTGKSINRAGIELASFLTKLSATHFGVRAFGEEIEQQRQRQEASRVAALAPAEARREAVWNFTPDKTMGYDDLDQRVSQIAKETRSKEEVVWGALSAAFSAAGDQSNDVTATAVRDALKIMPNNAGGAAILAGRGLDIAKFTGSTNIKTNLGYLANLQSASRIEDPTLLGKNVISSLGSARAYGDDPEAFGEITSAFAQLLGDTQGDRSATAYQKMAGQLKNYVPKRNKEGQLFGQDNFGKFTIPEKQFKDFQQATDSYQRMEAMRRSPELFRGFLGASSFEEKSREQTIAMIRGEANAMSVLKSAQEKVKPLDSRQDDLVNEKIRRMNSGDVQQRLSLDQSVQVGIQQGMLADVEDQRIGAARDALNKALKESGAGLPQQFVSDQLFDMRLRLGSLNPEQSAADELKRLKKNLAGNRAKAVQNVIESLEESGQAQKPLPNEREITNYNRTPAKALPDRDSISSRYLRDAQMDENNRLLRELVDQGRLTGRPVVTERKSSRLSRGNQ